MSLLNPYQKELVKMIRETAHRYRTWEIFRDFCEMAALEISNAVDLFQRGDRAKRYAEICKRYNQDELAQFPKMFAAVVDSLEAGISDCLGPVFMDLELGSHWKGQYFSPPDLAKMLAAITIPDPKAELAEKQFVTVSEPAAGSGTMVIALAEHLLESGVNYQDKMHVTATDVDATAVHMCYVQLSLIHCPAVVVHGNTLSLEEWSRWFTPAHVLNLWGLKLRRRHRQDAQPAQVDQADDDGAIAAMKAEVVESQVQAPEREPVPQFGT